MVAAVVGVLTLLVVSSLGVGTSDHPSALLPSLPVASGDPLAAAIASLSAGAGPAGGRAWQCTSASLGASASCSAPSASVAPPTLPSWTSSARPSPGSRDAMGMTFDAADGYDLLFGGLHDTTTAFSYLNDTWSFSNGTWTPIDSTVEPPARAGASMAYDTHDKEVVLFGGYNATLTFSDTWTFSHGQWSLLAPSNSPPALAFASLAFDTKLGRLVLFGGLNAADVAQNETWTFQKGAWSPLHLTVAPSPRAMAATAYDPVDGELVLFGGMPGTFTALNDTWAFFAGAWHRVTGSGGPEARLGASLAWSGADNVLVLFGGLSATGAFAPGTTWTFVHGTWTKLGPANPPVGRYLAGMAPAANGSVVLYGGWDKTYESLGDTWAIQGGVWSKYLWLTPAARYEANMGYDEADGYVVLFGGDGGSSASQLADTWTFVHGLWTELNPSVSPVAVSGAYFAYDPVDRYMVLFGGVDHATGNDSQATWTFAHGVWTPIDRGATTPPGASDGGMVWDSVNNELVLFGGYNGSTGKSLNDTWLFVRGVWTHDTPPAGRSPPTAARVGMAYDAADGYVVLLIGVGHQAYSQTWTFTGGAWSNATANQTTSPSGRSAPMMVDDPYDGYVLMFGGQNTSSGAVLDDTWAFSNGGWTKLNPSYHPIAFYFSSGAYDAADHDVVLFGGVSSANVVYGEWLTY